MKHYGWWSTMYTFEWGCSKIKDHFDQAGATMKQMTDIRNFWRENAFFVRPDPFREIHSSDQSAFNDHVND